MAVETGKITQKFFGAEVGKSFEKRNRSCDAKNFVKIRLSKHPKIEDVRCQFWRDFWTGESKDPNFGMANLHFWAPSPHVFMIAESGLKASSIKPHVCPLKKTSEQVECPLVLGQGGKGVCCHPNVFILSIVM